MYNYGNYFLILSEILVTMTPLKVKALFETERLKIRKIVPTDTVGIFSTYASLPKATKFISWKTHKSVEKDTLPFVDYALQAWNAGTDFTYMILKHSGEVVGSVGFINEKGRVSFGYILGSEALGQWIRSRSSQRNASMVWFPSVGVQVVGLL